MNEVQYEEGILIAHKRDIFSCLDEFLSIETNASEISQFQEKRLREVFEYAFQKVPFYNKYTIETDVSPFSKLKDIPIIGKRDILQDYENFISDELNPDSVYSTKTSGSTGIPFISIKDNFSNIISNMNMLKVFVQYGIHEDVRTTRGTRILRIAGRINGFKEHHKSTELYRLALVGINSPLEEFDKQVLEEIIKYQPEIISGHASEILLLCNLFDSNELKPEMNSVKFIISGGETLNQNARWYIENYFDARVIDVYGMQEIGEIAYECSDYPGNYHIHEDSVYVEVIDENGNSLPDGHKGEFVITNLINKSMPFIRYRTGDYGIVSPVKCKCKRAARIINTIDGRSMAPLILKNGSLLNPYVIKRRMEDARVTQYQVIQKEQGKLTINLVLGENANDAIENIKRMLSDYINDGTEIELKICSIRDIVSPNGKIRAFISKLDPEFINNSK
ncbi:AMP-binding protein [Paenibacillus sp. MZ04-78.2]|uniref:phenylacetate--CoA ligase family protein n=1 Tax=Paenibacillus sp. MZ04-78.2 TaxID=2962034 RepID=UPI0020B7F1AD|nr:AMP-binding protein [Paenibacillus sp. MZ04-78.2]MCP3776510.1 AMP-binding protein [Paenibacillus sp. MZ04-78.2]